MNIVRLFTREPVDTKEGPGIRQRASWCERESLYAPHNPFMRMKVLLQRWVFLLERDFFHAKKDAMMEGKKQLMAEVRPFIKGNAQFMHVVPRVFHLKICVVR